MPRAVPFIIFFIAERKTSFPMGFKILCTLGAQTHAYLPCRCVRGSAPHAESAPKAAGTQGSRHPVCLPAFLSPPALPDSSCPSPSIRHMSRCRRDLLHLEASCTCAAFVSRSTPSGRAARCGLLFTAAHPCAHRRFGSGKSVLARSILGLAGRAPTTGSIRFLGRELVVFPRRARCHPQGPTSASSSRTPCPRSTRCARSASSSSKPSRRHPFQTLARFAQLTRRPPRHCARASAHPSTTWRPKAHERLRPPALGRHAPAARDDRVCLTAAPGRPRRRNPRRRRAPWWVRRPGAAWGCP